MRLDHAPGLCLQARRLVEKKMRGINTLQGRRSVETDREAALIADAGLTLSLHAANLSLAREFGIAASHCRISLDMLQQHSLPTAPLALNFDNALKTNFMLIDQRYPKAPEAPRSGLASLVIFFDSHR